MGKKYVPEKIAEKLSDYYQNGWQILFDEGMQMQDDVLLDIISLGNNSAYAKDHGFAGIKTKEEFRARVPISEYSDYRKYIDATIDEISKKLYSCCLILRITIMKTKIYLHHYFHNTHIPLADIPYQTLLYLDQLHPSV